MGATDDAKNVTTISWRSDEVVVVEEGEAENR